MISTILGRILAILYSPGAGGRNTISSTPSDLPRIIEISPLEKLKSNYRIAKNKLESTQKEIRKVEDMQDMLPSLRDKLNTAQDNYQTLKQELKQEIIENIDDIIDQI